MRIQSGTRNTSKCRVSSAPSEALRPNGWVSSKATEVKMDARHSPPQDGSFLLQLRRRTPPPIVPIQTRWKHFHIQCFFGLVGYLHTRARAPTFFPTAARVWRDKPHPSPGQVQRVPSADAPRAGAPVGESGNAHSSLCATRSRFSLTAEIA